MTTLTELRTDLATVIDSTGAPAHDHLPERLTPPVQVIEPGSPYLTDEADGLTFGEIQVAFDVVLVARRGTSAAQTKALDVMVQDLYAAVDASAWFVREVEQPYALVMPDQSAFLATRVRVTTTTTLTP